ncbi:BglG family transcription antiterminator [Dielma fastidiosa]|uniref:Lichenan operon transcriptional antiterminator n=2 Tax=Dielma fastidiosa TaxID=1034346 RepID=A0A318KIM2_9FIRM|nr:PRD domain-containing protein [Dielma fastidiosa]PXX75927.1 lichenan operon transcriptional antiterminator [Dielma fastidiosa]
MLTKRQIEIFMDYYAHHDEIIKSKILADKYNISIRTIQNDIQVIRDEVEKAGAELKSISSKGHVLLIKNQALCASFADHLTLDYNSNYFFDVQASRVDYLLSTLITSHDFIKSQDLADAMYISRSRISVDLALLKEVLKKYNLSLVSKPYYGLKIEGSEINKRQCIIKENLCFAHNFIQNEKDEPIINEVKNIVTQILVDSHYKISDIALQNLIIHIATAIERMRSGNYLEQQSINLKDDDVFHHVLEISNKIIQSCCNKYSLPYTESEVVLLALNLQGKREYDQQEYISDEINKKIYHGLQQINENYNLDLTNDLNLRISLGLHILPLLSRLKTGMLLKNIMTYTIKQKFPFAFDIASTFTYSILPEYKERLSDDEISYLALHFSVSLNQTTPVANRKDILLICSQQKSETILIQQKIKQWFNNINEIKTVSASMVKPEIFDDYNAILTTESKIAEAYPKAMLVNYFLTDTDYQKIEMALNGFTSVKDILDKFDEDLFYYGNVKDKYEMIDILFKKAKKKFKLSDELYDSVMLHEKIASSCFGNKLAIPHPERLITDCTFITVGIPKEEIIWEGDTSINLVMLVSIDKNNVRAYQLWYYLSFLISNKDMLDRITKVPTYENLISIINDVYKNLF